jgi:RsmE family RNA methyltransferase
VNLILFEENELGKPLLKGDPRAAHLTKTLRKAAGDEFDAGVLWGRRGKGRIERIGGGGELFFSLFLTESPPARLPVTVTAGFPRPIQTRRLLRDLSSRGVCEITLAGCDLGDKNYLNTTLLEDGGARAALVDGAVQARDTTLPRLAVFRSLGAWLEQAPWTDGARPRLIACDNVDPQGDLSAESRGEGHVALAIGPERGWSDWERLQLEAAGFKRLSLGRRALRVETACVAAVAAVQIINRLG